MELRRNTAHTPPSKQSRKLLHGGVWLEGFMIAVSAFSLVRETLDQSWPLWRVAAHSAILAAFALLLVGTLHLLRRGGAATDRRPSTPDRRPPPPARPTFRQPHVG